MDNITLASDESIIHKTQKIVSNGVRYEVVLTSRRLILVESETDSVREDIPFTEIDQAISGVNKLRESILTLIINTPDGEKRTIELIFIPIIGNQNIVELEKCITILKEHDVPIGGINQVAIRALLNKRYRKNPDDSIVKEKASRPAVPEWTIFGPTRDNKESDDEDPPERAPLNTIGVLILIVVVLIVGMTLIAQTLHEKPQLTPQNMTEVTSEATPAPTPTPTSEVTPTPTESQPSYNIPPTGVWVRVQYPGNFSGSIGAGGRNVEISGSGVKWYQLPVVDPNIDGTIAKLDGSADKMDVDVYQDGTLVLKRSTQVPYGIIELHMPEPVVITNDVVTTPVPTQPPQSWITDANRPQIKIPPTGVWVLVLYPGNFSGYIGQHGRNIEVNGSGIQWYQLPVVDPKIEGTIAKLDGSADRMDVDVYQDAKLISRSLTKIPYGVIELHMTEPGEIMNDVTTTPVPTPTIQAVEDYLPKISIPVNGVWVRVYYPGDFSGSIGGQGISTPIKSTGDQLYEIPANVGIVEGTIEKNDGSVGRMVIEVYKDRNLISQMETRTPEGLIDIHVPV
jgi:hypothetical protein